MHLTSLDITILQSIARGSSTIRDVISFVDYIDHSVITFEEFSSAMQKLSRGGLIERSENTIRATATFKEWIDLNMKKKLAVDKEFYAIKEYLSLNYKEEQLKTCIFSRAEFDQALMAYSK
jgi:hypothetical protein